MTGDQETWMLPVYLAFWPKQAEAALQYRVDRIPTARVNARTPVFPGAAQHRGLRFPVSSAITGIEQCVGSTEDHVQGDVSHMV
jgi:trehalose/maltose hydrolase-like predicted phosphorylase